jgi:hypothetical protein
MILNVCTGVIFNADLAYVGYVCFLVPYFLILVCFVVFVLVLRFYVCTLCFLCVVTLYMLLLSFAFVFFLCSLRDVLLFGSCYLVRVVSYPVQKATLCVVMFVGLL